jgi:hypothetical protein
VKVSNKTQIRNGKIDAKIMETNGRWGINETVKNYILVKQRRNQTHLTVTQMKKVKRNVRPSLQNLKKPCPRFP